MCEQSIHKKPTRKISPYSHSLYVFLSFFLSLNSLSSDLDNFSQGGWEGIPDYVSYQANSNSSGGGSSDVLSPSLQSYLNAHDPSWAGGSGGGGGGGGGSHPTQQQQRRDPTAIYRAEIARMGRRFGYNNRVSGGKGPHSSRVERRSARAAASAYSAAAPAGSPSAGSYHTSPIRDGRSINNEVSRRKWRGVIPQRSYQVEGILEQGWDGRVTLTGKPSWSESGRSSVGPARSVRPALRSTENSRYFVPSLCVYRYVRPKTEHSVCRCYLGFFVLCLLSTVAIYFPYCPSPTLLMSHDFTYLFLNSDSFVSHSHNAVF